MRTVVILTVALFVLLAGGTGAALLVRHHDRKQATRLVEEGLANPTSDPRGAIRALEIAIELDPRVEAKAQEKIAEIKRLGRDHRGAFLAASRALELDPGLKNALMTRGLARAELRDRDGAGDDFARLLALDAKCWQAHALLGNVESARGDSKAAIEHYTAAIALHPASAMPWRRRARERVRLKDFVAAQSDLFRAGQLDPREPATHLDWARLHAAQGHPQQELSSLNRAIEIAPDDPEVVEYRDQLRARLAAAPGE